MAAEAIAEKDLEEQLLEAGKKLLKPPAELDEILRLLEVLENCLGRVEQSPSKSMSTALCPSMKSLVSPVLLRHSSKDVKLSVATCLSEITRITAPDAPYDDELMKEIFQMIVTTFADLSDSSSPSFAKRVLILETVAKVRSCVVMLDLECDDLIVEMFRHFFRTIREDHAECIFTSMEAILTVVLEESEDIPLELISILLDKLKMENQEVSPIARRLVEKVMDNCAAKLKPYLIEVVKSMGMSLNDYSKIVPQICQGTVENIDHNDLGASSNNLTDGSKVSTNNGQIVNNEKDESKVPVDVESTQKSAEQDQENVSPGAVEDADQSVKTKLSNVSLTSSKEDSSRDDHSPKRNSGQVSLEKDTSVSTEVSPENTDQQNNKIEAMSSKATRKTKARKPNSLKNSTDVSGLTQNVPEDKAAEQSKSKKRRMKENEPLPSEGPSVNDVAVASESEKEIKIETVQSLSQSQHPVAARSKKSRGRSAAQKEDAKAEPELSALPREELGTLADDSGKEETSPLMINKSENEPESQKSAEVKSVQRSSKKADATNDDESTPATKRRGRKVKGSNEKIKDHRKTGDSSTKKSSVVKKSADLTFQEGMKHAKGSSIRRSSGRNAVSKEETPRSTDCAIAYDESLVGSRIKVWWPLDKMFYEGSIVSYDPSKKKYKVSYADGDQEDLMLSKEHWEYLDAEQQEGRSTSGVGADAAAETPPPKKKVRTSYSSTKGKQVKDETPLKKRKETPSGKSKGITPKSSTKVQSNGLAVRGKSGSAKTQQESGMKGKKRLRRSSG